MEINQDRLRELASDPANGIKEICAGLGMTDPTFYQHLKRDPELKKIYTEARAVAKEQPRSAKDPRKTGRKSSQKTSKKTSAPPPRNGNAKADHKGLFAKLRLELEHIAVYECVSEHFEELRQEVAAQV